MLCLKFVLPGLKSALYGVYGLFGPHLSPQTSNLPSHPQTPPLRPPSCPPRLQISHLKPQSDPPRPQISPFRKEEWKDEQKSPCALQDFVFFGVAALVAFTPIHNHVKQGIGYRWQHSFTLSHHIILDSLTQLDVDLVWVCNSYTLFIWNNHYFSNGLI